MATVTAPHLASQRFRLDGVSWDFYEHLLEELGDRRVRVTFDRGALELMAPTYRHENYAVALGDFVKVICEETGADFQSGRTTTFRREDLARGLEPDDCFYIRNVRKILGKSQIDLTLDPPPDLAIEIDISHSSLDRMKIYAALGVPEVWRFDGRSLEVHCLTPDGDYELRTNSPTFPTLPIHRLADFLGKSTAVDEGTLVRRFRAWVRKQVVPRRKRNAR